MTTQLRALRPVITQPEADFGTILGTVISPSRPLQSEEYLRGRAEQLSGIKKALYQPGRHALIHGFRGVGKSSLAQTAAYALSVGGDPILVSCDSHSTLASVIRDVCNEALNKNPSIEKKVKEASAGFTIFGFNASGKRSTQETAISEAGTVNEMVRSIKYIFDHLTYNPVIVVDEFDQVKNKEEQERFTNFIKQISDRHISVRFIFCGIGESVDAIMAAHGSADRYFHTVGLGRLPWEARFDIVLVAAGQLGIEIDTDTVIRIARISDGFPHYVHFISEKLFWRVYEARNDGMVTAELFEGAMSDAAEGMEMRLKGPYQTATRKYSNDYEFILFSAADGHELQRRSTDIFESYQRISKNRLNAPLDRSRFNQRLNSLKQPSHASILTGTRQGWYEFTEKMIRGYVRLRAEQHGLVLESDHPALVRVSPIGSR